ncbi:transglycosylase SLT domain-containing protein [Peribacillus sp. SCS-26]|uniref:transglycosylase SLT domain-containing protein n=1 Tax=Paraperibacillus marinus TaxID=3115295 RepID=UPI0039066E11
MLKSSRLIQFVLPLLLLFALSGRAEAATAPGAIVDDAYKAAKLLDYYSSGAGATGKMVPAYYLNRAQDKYTAALKKLTAAQEKTYKNKLSAANTYINRGKLFIAGVKGGQSAAAVRLKLENSVKSGKADPAILILLDSEIKKQSAAIQKIYSSTAEARVYSLYIKPAKTTLSSYSKALAVKKNLIEANKYKATAADYFTGYYKGAMTGILDVPQAAMQSALQKEFEKLTAAIAAKPKKEPLKTYYEAEILMEKLGALIKPGISGAEVPKTYDLLGMKISSSGFTAAEKAKLKTKREKLMKPLRLTPKEVKTKLTKKALNMGVPPEIVKAIAFTENSSFRQFTENGDVYKSPDNGYGITQLTPPSVTDKSYDWDRVKYDIDYNIESGIDLLVNKWNYSGTVIPEVNRHVPMVLEDWYFTLMAYNGIAKRNNPNDSPVESTYQMKVYHAINQLAQVSTDYLAPRQVKLVKHPDTEMWYFDDLTPQFTEQATPSTQMVLKDEEFTFKQSTTFRSSPAASGTKTIMPAGTEVKVLEASIEDENPYNLYNWYKVQIPRQNKIWYVASQNFIK